MCSAMSGCTPSRPRGVTDRFKIQDGADFSVTSPIGRGRIASAMRSIVRRDPGEGLGTIDRPYPLTPTLSPWERGCTFFNSSLRGAQRRSNPWFSKWRDGLLRGACHRARIRATRWLAMTITSSAVRKRWRWRVTLRQPALQTARRANHSKPVQPCRKKYSASPVGQINGLSLRVSSE